MSFRIPRVNRLFRSSAEFRTFLLSGASSPLVTIAAIAAIAAFAACHSGSNKNEGQPDTLATNVGQAAAYIVPVKLNRSKIEAAVSCTKGLSARDSITFLKGGGASFQPTIENKISNEGKNPDGMVLIPGGEFSMGGVDPMGMEDGGHEKMDDARPIHRVYIDPFFMDEHEVTNAQFAAFVKATGYISVAEQKPGREEFPTAPEENLVTGSVVFSPPDHAVPLDNNLLWWQFLPGADWRHPRGRAAREEIKPDYPVVQVCYQDAAAYAKWAHKRLPSEAEWEFAARGGKTGNLYPWGNEFKPQGKWMANIFQGQFPDKDIAADGYGGIAPVERFAPNKYGLYDMAGNVWEWCNDWYRQDYYASLAAGGIVKNPRGPDKPLDPQEPMARKKVQRGGSFLCTDQYCTRYMVGTRGKGEWRSAANHIGFRCVKDREK
ncbi:formylglycine-generating enzyme family protein [Flavitalea flava]